MENSTELHIALHNMHVSVKSWRVLIIAQELHLKQQKGKKCGIIKREEVWDYENGFPAGLIATILEDYGRRMVKVKFGSKNIVDTVSWPMLLDGPCSNARTINRYGSSNC